MKTLLVAAVLAAPALATFAADEYVSPYVKKDGTVVQGHMQTAPNNTKLDNYSTRGNVNPYTGVQGTKDPFASPRPAPVVTAPAPAPVYATPKAPAWGK